MKRDEVLAKLREHEAELKAAGVISLALFGSVARNDHTEASDVDVVLRLSDDPSYRGFRHFGRIEKLRDRFQAIVGCPVDILTEPMPSSVA